MVTTRWLPVELVEAMDRIEAALERPWPLAAMAGVAGYSPFHFHRAFRQAVAETPVAFVERLRLERAALYLLASATPITHLAWEVGFRNPETFARRFRKRFGIAARDYRRSQLDRFARFGLEAGADPLGGPGEIRVERLPAIRVRARRSLGDDAAFDLEPGQVGLTFDWPGITEPGRVRQEVGATCASRRSNGVVVSRTVGDGVYATLLAENGTAPRPGGPDAFQRLFIWAMGGRHRLRAGAFVEMQQHGQRLMCLPVADTEKG